ncbi:MAG: polysaccharide deacetylase family protein [Actinomycetota bacterium]
MTILCYHSVQPGWNSPLAVSPQSFARHVAWLARARLTVDLDAAVARMAPSGRLPRRTVALTFDDGFSGIFDHALPLLTSHRIPATVFVVAETLTSEGRLVDWVDDPPASPLAAVSRDQVLEMQEAGVQFGSHSYAHHDLTSLSEEQCEHDLRRSREVLEDLLGASVTYLAYPRGLHSEPVRRAAARAGFTHGFALPESRQPVGPYSVPRVGIYPTDGVLALRVKTSEWYVPLRRSRAFPVLRRLAGRGPARVRPAG